MCLIEYYRYVFNCEIEGLSIILNTFLIKELKT